MNTQSQSTDMYELAIVPNNKKYYNNGLFKVELARDRILEPWVQFREVLSERGIQCNTLDICNSKNVNAAIFFRLDVQMDAVIALLRENPTCRLMLFAFEPPPICGLHESNVLAKLDVDRIFSWREDLVDNVKVFKVNEPRAKILRDRVHSVPFTDRHLLVTIVGNKDSGHPQSLYKKRREVMRDLTAAGLKVDLFGVDWDKSDDPIIRSLWKGAIDEKYTVQSRYRFSLCFENAAGYPGFVSEKIFDAFAARSIPVYYGAPNIEKIIPSECFVDFRDFGSIEDLVKFILSITEEQYNRYIDNIDAYMDNIFPKTFSGIPLAHVLAREVEQLSSEKLPERKPSRFFFNTFISCLGSTIKAPRRQKFISAYRILRHTL